MASATRETPKATRPARRLSNRTTKNVKIEDVGLLRMVSLATLIAWWHENAATASKCCVGNMPKHQCRESPHLGCCCKLQRTTGLESRDRCPRRRRRPARVLPDPLNHSRHPSQPRRLRVSLLALIAVEPASTAAQCIFSKYLK